MRGRGGDPAVSLHPTIPDPARGPTPVLELEDAESPFVPGLRVTSKVGTRPGAVPFSPANAIVVGTIRMGFGHHRIAYAATSWALGAGKKTYFHDLVRSMYVCMYRHTLRSYTSAGSARAPAGVSFWRWECGSDRRWEAARLCCLIRQLHLPPVGHRGSDTVVVMEVAVGSWKLEVEVELEVMAEVVV